jgi:hypothetical protein
MAHKSGWAERRAEHLRRMRRVQRWAYTGYSEPVKQYTWLEFHTRLSILARTPVRTSDPYHHTEKRQALYKLHYEETVGRSADI